MKKNNTKNSIEEFEKKTKKVIQENEFLTTAQAQIFLGISRAGLYNLVVQKKVKQYCINGLESRKAYKKSDLQNLYIPA